MFTLKTLFYIILRVLSYVTGFCGVFGIIGTVGSLELDRITFGQFWLQEFFCVGLILLTIVVYYIRETFKYRHLRNYRNYKN